MAQLRHMAGAVPSGKTQVENQQHILLSSKIGQPEMLTSMIGQGKIGNWITHA
jgi:hypothetical protein